MRYLSGVQASGRLHLGNYFGALRHHIDRQDRGECFFFIADYHSLTSVDKADVLRENVRNAVLDYVALGLSTEKAVFFRQSDVPESTELGWILGCVTPMGLLERCHAYKDKVAKGLPASLGLFSYPVLMAADILLYRADRVPVGKDQVQHVEVTRDIAMNFNRKFPVCFLLPEVEVDPETAVVPGTDGQKMSKSRGNTIPIFGTDKEIEKAVMGIVTDAKSVDDPKDPVTSTIFQLYRQMAGPADIEAMSGRMKYGRYGYGEAKRELLRVIQEYFAPFRQKRAVLEKENSQNFWPPPTAQIFNVEQILAIGAQKARKVAASTMKDVRKAVGLGI